MHADRPLEQSSAKQDAAHLAIILAIGLFVGIYLIVTAVVISEDGAAFVQFARNLRASPVETMLQEPQHPGYPYLILATANIAEVFCQADTLSAWVYSAQAVTLTFRLAAIVLIYYMGKLLVGPKPGFVAALLLIVLPLPARYGSEALSDWPALFFVIAAMLLLVHGAMRGGWWLFGLAGAATGAGYLVRPECAQIIACGLLWLTLQLFAPKRNMSRPRTALAIAAFIIGFCALTAPYMNLKGAAFPKKDMGEFASDMHLTDEYNRQPQMTCDVLHTADLLPAKIMEAFLRVFGNIGEMVMWFFLPAIFIGFCDYFKQRLDSWMDPKRFFPLAALVFGAIPLIWLYGKHSYMSKRHTLLMVAVFAFFIRRGLQILAALVGSIVCPRPRAPRTAEDYRNFFYVVLLIAGISLCIPKLLKPLHRDKLFIRQAAEWFAEYGEPQAVIAARDYRIGFYAEREGIAFNERKIPEEADYVVIREGREAAIDEKLLRIAALIEDDRGNLIVSIYRRAD
ncbi:MAG: ArnT family glycosyltransferase [Planctomycetota bacterium]|jgi:4-amino-4-deoxy-L-arabinose transferase-like glycosyltransferase